MEDFDARVATLFAEGDDDLDGDTVLRGKKDDSSEEIARGELGRKYAERRAVTDHYKRILRSKDASVDPYGLADPLELETRAVKKERED
ncbi:hypothetical protein AB5J62_09255 [Amycolatopsis sp. cg5]|uniref:hypothetical protein n=1 Tax=Amycolatopsis sp. cg5 TaxID=3238802 RepID=UPI003523332A